MPGGFHTKVTLGSELPVPLDVRRSLAGSSHIVQACKTGMCCELTVPPELAGRKQGTSPGLAFCADRVSRLARCLGVFKLLISRQIIEPIAPNLRCQYRIHVGILAEITKCLLTRKIPRTLTADGGIPRLMQRGLTPLRRDRMPDPVREQLSPSRILVRCVAHSTTMRGAGLLDVPEATAVQTSRAISM
jgi:hypothetical protein